MAVLRAPAFQRYLFAGIATTSGLWLFETGLFWVALVKTGSATSVGLILSALVLPFLIILVPAGAFADRVGPKPLLLLSQLAWVVIIAVGAVIAQFGLLTFPVVLGLALAEGAFDAVWAIPAQMMFARVVERRLMANAIVLSGLQVAFGRLVGGGLAGALLTLTGPTITFAAGAVCVAIGAFAVWGLKSHYPIAPTSPPTSSRPAGPVGRFEVIKWFNDNPTVVSLVALGACAALFAFAYLAVLPVVSRDLIHAGPGGLGLMTAAGGVGVLITVAFGDVLGRRFGRGVTLAASVVLAAASIAVIGLSSSLLVSVVCAGLLAACLNAYFLINNLLLQSIAPSRLRGRVLSIYGLVFWALLPVGTLTAGFLVDSIGARSVLFLMAGLTLLSLVVVVASNRSLVALDVDASGLIVSRLRVPPRITPPVTTDEQPIAAKTAPPRR